MSTRHTAAAKFGEEGKAAKLEFSSCIPCRKNPVAADVLSIFRSSFAAPPPRSVSPPPDPPLRIRLSVETTVVPLPSPWLAQYASSPSSRRHQPLPGSTLCRCSINSPTKGGLHGGSAPHLAGSREGREGQARGVDVRASGVDGAGGGLRQRKGLGLGWRRFGLQW